MNFRHEQGVRLQFQGKEIMSLFYTCSVIKSKLQLQILNTLGGFMLPLLPNRWCIRQTI